MPEVEPLSLSKTGISFDPKLLTARPALSSNRSTTTDTVQEVNSSFLQTEVNQPNTEESMPPMEDDSVVHNDGENSEDGSVNIGENSSSNDQSEVEEDAKNSTPSVNDDECDTVTGENYTLIQESPTLFQDSKSFNKTHVLYTSLFLIVFAVFIPIFLVNIAKTAETFDFEALKEEFPTQDPDLWYSFEAGVQDVVTRSRPSTFILLYREEAKNTLSNLLEQLSKYAVCNITDCSHEPIVITDSLLNSSEIVNDFGLMITKYKGDLEEKGVMVIKNLENVRGVSAQAFHSFCDEYTPLVDKSLFIFTMKVDKLYGPDKMRFVEEYFRSKWTDIKVDTFNALITRITSMVLEVVP